MRTILMTTIMVSFFVSGQALAQVQTSPETRPIPVPNPGFPFKAQTAVAPDGMTKVKLTQASAMKNQIIDEAEWLAANGFQAPLRGPGPGAEVVPAETEYGTLKFFRPLPDDFRLAIYQKTAVRTEATKEKGISSVYDKVFTYVAVVYDSGNLAIKAYDLDALFPGILEMSNAQVVGKTLYFDINYNGYADLMKKKTGYLVAMDVFKGEILWSTPALTSAYPGFLVMEDHIIAGYGFTDEPDFLFVINRYTGKVEQKLKLKTAHDYLFRKGNQIFVRCYDMDYVFEF